MINWKTFAGGVAVSVIAAAATQQASAQITSSSMTGQVRDAAGNAVSDATVTILHEPTGTTEIATTSSNGIFFGSGLRVGGPYTISIQSDAGQVVRQGISLQPSSNAFNFKVADDEARTLDTIIVRGSTGGLDLNDGVGSIFSSDDILNQPSTERDLIATLVNDPLAFSSGEGEVSIAGVNPRFNALAIDGALQQDDFGLSDSTYPSSRSPISLDAVESASISASDYSVKSSGFTGGLVNVITKSGSNEFDGSLYYYRQDEDFFGNAAFDQFVERAPFLEEEYGFSLGGPILKDKLFFFVTYDEFETGSSDNFTQSDIDNNRNPAIFVELNQIVQDVYGFDLGGRPTTVSLPETSERFFGKVDWNINNDHRASISYQSTEETGVLDVGSTTFQSAFVNTPVELDVYTAQLFSDWTPNLSTEFRFNYKEFSRGQNCFAGTDIGEFEINLSEADLVGTPLEGFLDDGDDDPAETFDSFEATGGCDRFRQGNTFDDERLQIHGSGKYTWNDHLITAGVEYQSYELDNLFARRSVGEFEFRSLDDLQNRVADVAALLPASGLREDIRAVWGYDQLALFAQDSWQVLPKLRVDAGLRYEVFIQDDEPDERTFFEDRFGDFNTENLDGNGLIMPRISFEYTPFERTIVTGGFGLFGGGDPKVWTSNAFTPPVFEASQDGVTDVDPTAGTPQALLNTITANDANAPGPIDVIDPDFNTPSDWKASFRVDQDFDLNFDRFGLVNLGEDYRASFQLLYSATNNGFRWQNLSQTDLAETQPTGVAPDGRPIFADLEDLGINNAIQLTNFDEGDSIVLSLALQKAYENGLGFNVAYAYQDIETVTPGTSSRGVSNFRAIFDSDRNNPAAGTSPFEVRHGFKANLSYETEVFGDLTSRFNLFGQFSSGDPFSYTFNVEDDAALFGRQGDGEDPFDNDLLYVPTVSGGAISDPLVVVGSGFQEGEFIEFARNQELEFGAIQEKNSDRGPWNQRWDFQWQQELPFANELAGKYVGENRLKFVLDIKNVANLLNDEWGTQFNGPRFDAINLISSDLVSAGDVAANGIDGATALTGDMPRTVCASQGDCLFRFNDFDIDPTGSRDLTRSVYEVRMGIRYEF